MGSVFPHDVPVTANHVVGDGPTKMIGARHGLGSATVASISEFPVAVAGKGPVATFVVVGLPSTIVRQLTIARNDAIGFVPLNAGGTGGPPNPAAIATVMRRHGLTPAP